MDVDDDGMLFPPMNGNPTELETKDESTNTSFVSKYEHIQNNEDDYSGEYELELNREAPGLFPPLKGINRKQSDEYKYESDAVMTESDKEMTTETESHETFDKHKHKNIDFKTFQKRILEKLPIDYEHQLINDKFFLTKMYTLNENISFDDFETYEKYLFLEDNLR